MNPAGSQAHDLGLRGPRLLEQAEALAGLEAGTLMMNDLGGKRRASLEGATPALRAAVRQARRQ